MRLDPGNFLLGHPAKKKFEMAARAGGASARPNCCCRSKALLTQSKAGGAGALEGVLSYSRVERLPLQPLELLALQLPVALQRGRTKAGKFAAGWRRSTRQPPARLPSNPSSPSSLGAMRKSVHLGSPAQKFRSGQPLVSCLDDSY